MLTRVLAIVGATALLSLVLSTEAAREASAAQAQRASREKTSDLERTLFEVANSMGMLRGLQQEDSILSLEVWGTGTMNQGGQAFGVTKHRLSLNYSFPGMRVDFTRQGPDGKAERQIQVVSGTYAWNETERGMGATPAPEAVRERLVQLWSTPMGVVKAARAAGARAKIAVEGGDTVLTFPLPPPVDDVTLQATLRTDNSLLIVWHDAPLAGLVGTYIVRVETRRDNVVTETTYAEYGDWNWDDYKGDAMLPRRIVQRRGTTVLDLTVANTNTYNPYVIMPVPDNVKTAAGLK